MVKEQIAITVLKEILLWRRNIPLDDEKFEQFYIRFEFVAFYAGKDYIYCLAYQKIEEDLMDFIFELIVELLVEGSFEASSNKKLSKWIRYPILFLLILFFAAVILGVLFLGFILLQNNILAAICMLFLGVFMLIGSIIKFRKMFLRKKDCK